MKLPRLRSGRGGVACVACSLVLGAASLTFAAPGRSGAGYALTHVGGFDHISTDRFDYNLNTGAFTIPGHFEATREGTDITADRASGNSKQKLMHAEGHVVVHENQASGAAAKGNELTQRPSTLTCDKLDVDGGRKQYTAGGNMHFSQEGGREANSDNAVLDDANHHLHMEGHVRIKNGDQTVQADVLDYDTLSSQLTGNGNVMITTPVATEPPIPRASAPAKKRRRLPF